MVTVYRHHVLIYDPKYEAYERIISKQLPDLEISSASDSAKASERIQDVEIILSWKIPDDLLMQAKNLRWFASTGAGNEHLVSNPQLPEGIILSKPTCYGEMMSGYVFTYILYFTQNLNEHFDNQKRKVWDRKKPQRLNGRILGIIGLGSIGKEIAKQGKQFGMSILGVKRTPEPIEYVDRVFGPEDLNEMIPQIDYLVAVVPLTSETYHMLGEREFSLMKTDSIFLNIGRGKTVDEKALIRILKRGRVKAVLDVFEIEPLPADSELWGMENVVITPHTSGITPIEEVCEEFIANYKRWEEGKMMKGLIDRKKGY